MSATRTGRRLSPSNRLLSSTSMVTLPATRSHSSPSVIMCSLLLRNGVARAGGQAVEPAFALGEAAEHVVVMHHRFAVGADLDIDFDAVIGGNRRAHPTRGVFDDAH